MARDRFGGDRFDTKVKRIKVKGLKDVRVFAADIKTLSAGKKLVISRLDYRAGPYYEKHLVQCDADDATHIKILGEGYTVLMMEGRSPSTTDRISHGRHGSGRKRSHRRRRQGHRKIYLRDRDTIGSFMEWDSV